MFFFQKRFSRLNATSWPPYSSAFPTGKEGPYYGRQRHLRPRKGQPASCQRHSAGAAEAGVVMQKDESVCAAERALHIHLQRGGQPEVHHQVSLRHRPAVRGRQHPPRGFSGGLPRADRGPAVRGGGGEPCVFKRRHFAQSPAAVRWRLRGDGARITVSEKPVSGIADFGWPPQSCTRQRKKAKASVFTVSVSCRFPLLHERMDEIKTFHSLKSLDLFGCRLGDNHEIFQHLTSGSLARY